MEIKEKEIGKIGHLVVKSFESNRTKGVNITKEDLSLYVAVDEVVGIGTLVTIGRTWNTEYKIQFCLETNELSINKGYVLNTKMKFLNVEMK